MIYVTAGVLVLWAIYSWALALALVLICFLIAIFYCGSISGEAQAKVIKTFCIVVIAVSLMMMGAIGNYATDGDQDAVKYCNAQAC